MCMLQRPGAPGKMPHPFGMPPAAGGVKITFIRVPAPEDREGDDGAAEVRRSAHTEPPGARAQVHACMRAHVCGCSRHEPLHVPER